MTGRSGGVLPPPSWDRGRPACSSLHRTERRVARRMPARQLRTLNQTATIPDDRGELSPAAG
jgi:hypothetical protein